MAESGRTIQKPLNVRRSSYPWRQKCIIFNFQCYNLSAIIFDGHAATISLKRNIQQEFHCHFDLQFYPFDTQVSVEQYKKFLKFPKHLISLLQTCSVIFQTTEKNSSALKFQVLSPLDVFGKRTICQNTH